MVQPAEIIPFPRSRIVRTKREQRELSQALVALMPRFATMSARELIQLAVDMAHLTKPRKRKAAAPLE